MHQPTTKQLEDAKKNFYPGEQVMPYIGRSTDGFGVRNRFLYLASASDTSVSGADANGATLTFTDGAYVDVYLNGVLLKAGTDYNTNTANTIAGLYPLCLQTMK